jgi:hypothetical protein
MATSYSESVIAMEESSFERLINIQAYSDAELRALASSLAEEEGEVSKRRRVLHAQIDIVRAEMVRRLRDKGQTGRALVQNGDVALLTDILAGNGPRDRT